MWVDEVPIWPYNKEFSVHTKVGKTSPKKWDCHLRTTDIQECIFHVYVVVMHVSCYAHMHHSWSRQTEETFVHIGESYRMHDFISDWEMLF